MRTSRPWIAAAALAAVLTTAFTSPESTTVADACDEVPALTAQDLTPGRSPTLEGDVTVDTVPSRPGHDTLPERMHEQAQALNQRLFDTLYFCHALEAKYPHADKTMGTVRDYGDYGDSAFYTAQLMAAEALRARVMIDMLEDHAVKGRARHAVRAHRDQALARVRTVLDQLHFNIHISEHWRGDGEPSVNTEPPELDPDHELANYGGLPEFEPGYPMRNCFPADARHKPRQSGRRFVITDEDGVDWQCEAGTSRDTYAGYFFGLLTTFDVLGDDYPDLRATIRDDILLMADFVLKYAWGTPRPHGRIALWPDSFDGSYSALFTASPFSRIWLVASARHVARVGGTLEQQAKWEAVWQEEWAANVGSIRSNWAFDATQPMAGYYKWNLTHLSVALLHGLLTDEDTATPEDRRRARTLLDAFGEVDYWTGDDENGWFATVTYALWGDPSRRADGARLLNDWVDYRAAFESGLDQGLDPARCELPTNDPQHLECRREDWSGRALPDGTEIRLHEGLSDKLVLATPRPVAERRPEGNLWQRWAGDLRGKDASRNAPPGVDYLLPYWLWRYLDEVAPPARRPGPLYPDALARA